MAGFGEMVLVSASVAVKGEGTCLASSEEPDAKADVAARRGKRSVEGIILAAVQI